jgi:transcription antitermination factor NusG
MERLVSLQLGDAGIEHFYPHVVERSRDHRRNIERRFMPGYVFSRFELGNKAPVVAIQQVVSILGWALKPAAIPSGEIEAIQKIVSFPSESKPAECAFLAEGTRVQVIRGPLRGLEGFVVYAARSARVVVSVQMLGRSISAEVAADALQKIEEKAAA